RPQFSHQGSSLFLQEFPNRVIGIDENERNTMGDRFFQILVGKEQGCNTATQFIGNIPKSKAVAHRHLYEESLIIVSGEGCMWTESVKTDVGSGDVIFLPKKQSHSLEATCEEGLVVAGVIYPGDNPSINY
ncbi:MAG: cupin domain-containing protein, partial [Pseudomonadota bacterium]